MMLDKVQYHITGKHTQHRIQGKRPGAFGKKHAKQHHDGRHNMGKAINFLFVKPVQERPRCRRYLILKIYTAMYVHIRLNTTMVKA